MNGLLHLVDVPAVPSGTDKLCRAIHKAIRQFCDTDHGRMIPIEDKCRELVSWYTLVADHSYLVRFANVDDKGKPFADSSFVQGLQQAVCGLLQRGGYLLVSEDSKERYEHLYHPAVFNGTDFLYVPNSPFCTTVVALRSR